MRVARILHGNQSLYLSFYIVAYSRSGAREIVRFTYTLENFIFLEKDRALFYKDARGGIFNFDVLFIVHELDRFFAR